MSANTEFYETQVICEICGEVCTDGFLIWEYVGSKYGWCLCDDCYNETYENMIEAHHDYRLDESFI